MAGRPKTVTEFCSICARQRPVENFIDSPVFGRRTCAECDFKYRMKLQHQAVGHVGKSLPSNILEYVALDSPFRLLAGRSEAVRYKLSRKFNRHGGRCYKCRTIIRAGRGYITGTASVRGICCRMCFRAIPKAKAVPSTRGILDYLDRFMVPEALLANPHINGSEIR